MIRVFSSKQKVPKGYAKVNSSKNGKFSCFHPSNLGPCRIYKGIYAINVQAAFEYSGVHKDFLDDNGSPSPDYWPWAHSGWTGKNPKSSNEDVIYHIWDGRKYGIIEARKLIFSSLYIKAVTMTTQYNELRESLLNTDNNIALIDENSYDNKNMSFVEVLHNTKKEMGHSFLLAMLLTNSSALSDIP